MDYFLYRYYVKTKWFMLLKMDLKTLKTVLYENVRLKIHIIKI